MGADPQYWRTVLPVCRFEGRELVGLELHPVELGFDLPAHQRGIPVLADDDEATAILDNPRPIVGAVRNDDRAGHVDGRSPDRSCPALLKVTSRWHFCSWCRDRY